MVIYTIVKNVEKEIVIEKSRFICSLQKVANEKEAQDFIKAIKKKYWDATHNCNAYLIDKLVQHSNDDGEPSGTAGVPILEVLKKADVQNVVAVVTRYFGGVKLGAGGLVRAYTNAVAGALQEAGKAQRIEIGNFQFLTNVNDAGKILNILYADGKYKVKDVRYGNQVGILLGVPLNEKEAAENYLTELLQISVQLNLESREFCEIAIDG